MKLDWTAELYSLHLGQYSLHLIFLSFFVTSHQLLMPSCEVFGHEGLDSPMRGAAECRGRVRAKVADPVRTTGPEEMNATEIMGNV